MKAIKIYTQESKYYMEDLDTNTKVELTKTVHDKRSDTDWLKLPENSCNRKSVCKQKVDEEKEVTYYERTPMSTDSKKKCTKSTLKIDPKDYYTEEEATRAEALQKELDELNAAVIARAEKEQAIKALEEQAMGLTIEQLKALIAKKEEAKA